MVPAASHLDGPGQLLLPWDAVVTPDNHSFQLDGTFVDSFGTKGSNKDDRI